VVLPLVVDEFFLGMGVASEDLGEFDVRLMRGRW
jgi:hypothetical protein